jgi:hypothetical protein
MRLRSQAPLLKKDAAALIIDRAGKAHTFLVRPK